MTTPGILLTATLTGLALAAGLGSALQGVRPDDPPTRKWDFQADTPGQIAKGYTAAVGRWEVVADGDNRVLAQLAKNENAVYNIAMAPDYRAADVDLGVRVKSVAGEIDQGGGLIWRAKDAKNYYICRHNPLELNYRVYKVVDGKRTQLATAEAPDDDAWYTLRATMVGSKITCYLEGKALLEAEDATFPEAGMIGLWTKADAQTHFDDLTAAGVKEGAR